MKKYFSLTTGVISCITGVMSIIALYNGNVTTFGILLGLTCIGSAVMILTDEQRTSTFKTVGLLFVIVMSVGLIISLSSCSRKGYGCQGKESWKHMEKRINKPY